MLKQTNPVIDTVLFVAMIVGGFILSAILTGYHG